MFHSILEVKLCMFCLTSLHNGGKMSIIPHWLRIHCTRKYYKSELLVREHMSWNKVPWDFCDESKRLIQICLMDPKEHHRKKIKIPGVEYYWNCNGISLEYNWYITRTSQHWKMVINTNVGFFKKSSQPWETFYLLGYWNLHIKYTNLVYFITFPTLKTWLVYLNQLTNIGILKHFSCIGKV